MSRFPPRGVPRWLWPPPGAEVRRVRILESAGEGGAVRHRILEGEALEAFHRGALLLLLEEHRRDESPADGRTILLEVAKTEMAGGRIGHAYALDGGPLGDPSASVSRGLLWRFLGG